MKKVDAELRAFILDNPQALSELRDESQMREAVRILLEAGKTYVQMLMRICGRCALPQVVFDELLTHVKNHPERHLEFAAPIGRFSRWHWFSEHNLSVPQDLSSYLTGGGVDRWLYARHIEGLSEESVLYVEEGGPANVYWTDVSQRYMATGDFKRAWDELKRAWKGIVPNSTPAADKLRGTVERRFMATKDVVGELALCLFNTMVEKKVLRPLVEEDLVVPSQKVEGRIYGSKPSSNGRAPQNRAYVHERPGVSIASQYPDPDRPGQLLPTGAAIIKIAAHFAEKTNLRKRLKHEEARIRFAAEHPIGR